MNLSEKTRESLRGVREELRTQRQQIDDMLAALEVMDPPALGPVTRANLQGVSSLKVGRERSEKPKRKYKKRPPEMATAAAKAMAVKPISQKGTKVTEPLQAEDGWMTWDEAATKLRLTDEQGIRYQIKKLVASGTLEHNGRKSIAMRYRVVNGAPREGTRPSAGTKSEQKEGEQRAVKTACTEPLTAHSPAADRPAVTLKAAVRNYVDGTPARGRFTRDQVLADVARARGGNISNDEQAQANVHLAELVKLDILECAGADRLTIYAKR